MKHHFLIFAVALLAVSSNLFAQERKDKAPVTFEEIYDEPYSVNKLFVGFQPLYGELFVTNVNAGFGLEAVYYHEDKFNIKAHFRKTYSRKFFDFARDISMNNSDVDNRAEVYNYYEVGGTYHVKDFEQASKTKMVLYKASYKGNRWASRVPLNAEVPCKVRKIYGVRLGGIMWDSSTELTRALEAQGLDNSALISGDVPLAIEEFNPNTGEVEAVDAFSNISSKGLYIGGSMSWFRNVAVHFDKFEEGVDDGMLTVFADILYSPSVTIDDVVYTSKDAQGNRLTTDVYSTSAIKTKSLGFRLGIDGRFNRTLSWSYGGEVGYRPSVAGRSFFAMFKISFPVYGTNLDYKVESFGK
ncbi:MAG TPA: hypothetical protein VGD65_18750 [Chryseosolibacter sp.]